MVACGLRRLTQIKERALRCFYIELFSTFPVMGACEGGAASSSRTLKRLAASNYYHMAVNTQDYFVLILAVV